jgi:ADP-ribose pyrophosphatase YjhB (NUDIX family)
MIPKQNFLEFAKRVHAIAETGLTFNENPYDRERYEELKEISFEIMNGLSGTPVEEIAGLFAHASGYQTPKVDVRGVVFRDNQILMVKEKIDGRWSVPGGWADVGLSPNEIAVKEVWEESGLLTRAVKLLAVLDKKCHQHPPTPWYTYKIFILCEIEGGELQAGMETLDANFFDLENLPELSTDRITNSQIELLFEYYQHPEKIAMCD